MWSETAYWVSEGHTAVLNSSSLIWGSHLYSSPCLLYMSLLSVGNPGKCWGGECVNKSDVKMILWNAESDWVDPGEILDFSQVPGWWLNSWSRTLQQGTIAVEAELIQTKISSGDYTKWPYFVLPTSKCEGQKSGGYSLLMGMVTSWAILEILSVIRKRYSDTGRSEKSHLDTKMIQK